MSVWGWVTIAYLSVFGAIGAYALRTLIKARDLAARVPDEDKPWT